MAIFQGPVRPGYNLAVSGGLGAVSFGISEALVELLGVLLLIAINLALRGPAQRRGPWALQLRRVHLAITAAYILINMFALLTPPPENEAELNALIQYSGVFDRFWRAFLWMQICFFVAAVT